jgi:hypothetical protein
MFFKSRWLAIYVGPDFPRMLAASVALALFPKWEKREQYGLVSCLLGFTASWNWLPRIVRVRVSYTSPWNIYDACPELWTGRFTRVIHREWLACLSVEWRGKTVLSLSS